MDTKLWFEEIDYILSLFDVFLNYTFQNIDSHSSKKKIQEKWGQLRNYLTQRVFNKKEIHKFVQDITSDVEEKVINRTSFEESEDQYYNSIKLSKEESQDSFLVTNNRHITFENHSSNLNSDQNFPETFRNNRERRQRFQSSIIKGDEIEKIKEKPIEYEINPVNLQKPVHKRNQSQPLMLLGYKQTNLISGFDSNPPNHVFQNSPVDKLVAAKKAMGEISKHKFMINEIANKNQEQQDVSSLRVIFLKAESLSKNMKDNTIILKNLLKNLVDSKSQPKKTRAQKFLEEKLKENSNSDYKTYENHSQNQNSSSNKSGQQNPQQNYPFPNNPNFYGNNIMYHPQIIMNPSYQYQYQPKRFY